MHALKKIIAKKKKKKKREERGGGGGGGIRGDRSKFTFFSGVMYNIFSIRIVILSRIVNQNICV
jgi:hypothetical protein